MSNVLGGGAAAAKPTPMEARVSIAVAALDIKSAIVLLAAGAFTAAAALAAAAAF